MVNWLIKIFPFYQAIYPYSRNHWNSPSPALRLRHRPRSLSSTRPQRWAMAASGEPFLWPNCMAKSGELPASMWGFYGISWDIWTMANPNHHPSVPNLPWDPNGTSINPWVLNPRIHPWSSRFRCRLRSLTLRQTSARGSGVSSSGHGGHVSGLDPMGWFHPQKLGDFWDPTDQK